MTAQDERQIRDLFEAGTPPQDIARQLNWSRAAVFDYLYRSGLYRNPKPVQQSIFMLTSAMINAYKNEKGDQAI